VSLFYDLITGMAHLQKIGFYHGNLTPDWIIKTQNGWSIADDPLTDFGDFVPDSLK
jgi:hypothetical protein